MKNPFSLEDRNIVITGGASGIGRASAIICSQCGANVILIDKNEQGLKETFGQLESGNHSFFAQDITEYYKIEPIISESVASAGKISGFIHSAGLTLTLPFKITGPAHYEKLYAVNNIAGYEIAKIISKKNYVHENGASFVFISSIMGLLGQEGNTAYCSSKGAIVAAVKAMALELAPKKIRVNCVLPAVVRTEMSENLFKTISQESMNNILGMHPLGLGKPEDIAYAFVFLLSDASKWMTGTSLIIDGGYSAH
jgi:NAD(P)-dependent dehydrogenase (short-subunit alcohol dehydrogenase family)